jgi:endonuclease I
VRPALPPASAGRRCLIWSIALLALLGIHPAAAQYDPPAGYYASAQGLTGPALKAALHSIIRNHTIIPYTANWTDTWDALKILDRDLLNPSNVRLIYNNGSVPAWDTGGDGNTSITENSWDREHLWPRSVGVGNEGADTSDLFNLRPIRGSINSSRGNRYYDQADPFHPIDPARTPPNCPECLYDYFNGQGGIWTPRPEEKGDIARSMFYMAVRYDGRDVNTTDLELTDEPNDAAGIFAFLSTLLQWHIEDPVSEAERQRNHLIYTQYQRNRNPFVDRPELVALVFGELSELPGLTVTVTPSAVAEGQSATGHVRIAVAVAQPVTVRLVKIGAAAADLTIPADVTVQPGQTAAEFPVTIASDAVADGDKEVSLIGLAANYEGGAASLLVLDAQGTSTGAVSSTFITGAGYYRQNFDALPSAGTTNWTDNSTLAGWYAQRAASNTTTIVATNGGSSTGGLYSFGTTGSPDRALGSLGSGGSGAVAWGVAFRNGTAGLLSFTSLSYTGEQWRSGGTNSAAQALSFSYQIGSGASDLTAGSDSAWNLLPSLDFTSPVNNTASGALNGDLEANRVAVSSGLDLILAPGAWITFRWHDLDHSGNDHGLAIDDFRLDWSVQPPGEKPEINGAGTASAVLGQAFQFQLAATGNPAFFEVEDLPPGLTCGPGGLISGTPQTAGTFTVRVLALNAAGAGTGTLVLTVEKAAPAITNLPVAAAIHLGQPLSAATLTGGAASVPGSFAFQDTTFTPPYGIAARTVVFTPLDTVNYGPSEAQVPVTVNYVTDFEGASKTTYASGDVALNGVSWNMSNALVGTLTNDFKNGAKSARLQGNAAAAMTMLSDLSGIGTFSFQHRRFGTDNQVQWIVERSTNQGGVWSEIGRFTAGTNAATFSASLESSSPSRLRIRNAATASGDRRANIDDIVITPYVAPALPLPVITSPLLGSGRVGEDFTYQLTAANSPDLLEIEELPSGLAVDPLTPGRIIGRPAEGGNFAVTLRAINAGGEAVATLQLAIDSSSYGEWSGEPGSGSPPSSSELLSAYAVGGAPSPSAAGEAPFTEIDGTGQHLVHSAVVRTDDPDLAVTARAVFDLADFGGPAEVVVSGERAADQTGVPVGHEHRLFRVPIGPNDAKKFLRLHIELGP